MGLDMYLKGKRFLWHNEREDNAWEEVDKYTNGRKVSSIELELAYWRKANAIHGWFVRNVQGNVDNCDEYAVKYSDLVKLRDTCKEALDNKNPELLPPQGGFFFGSTEIDDWYWGEIYETHALMHALCQDEDIKNGRIDVSYHSSW
ncbi:MAG: hypothetical protein ACO22M_00590 [Candidatus Nanopelagicaceae bacterium]